MAAKVIAILSLPMLVISLFAEGPLGMSAAFGVIGIGAGLYSYWCSSEARKAEAHGFEGNVASAPVRLQGSGEGVPREPTVIASGAASSSSTEGASGKAPEPDVTREANLDAPEQPPQTAGSQEGRADRGDVEQPTAASRAVPVTEVATATPRTEVAAAPPPPAALLKPATKTEADDLDRLERLHALMTKGVITAEDFEAKKKAILGLP
jgi:hypothetical protein